MPDEAIELVRRPRDADYEEYICAYFQAGGLYVEKSITYREVEELLELDIITTDFDIETIDKKLIEIKSGKWGFSEIFKVKGWLVYLEMNHGVFVIQNTRPSINYYKNKAAELNIDLIDNSDLDNTIENLSDYLVQNVDESAIETLRFAYLMERRLLKRIKRYKRENPDFDGYKHLDDYFYKISSGSFFSSSPIDRIKKLFRAYIRYKNITSKICYEIENGEYDDEVEELSGDCYGNLFYNPEYNILQISLYVEHIARLTILKSCIEHLIKNHSSHFNEQNFINRLDYLALPQNIQDGLSQIVREPYFNRYPIFWQWFTYVMGGFILTDFEEEEYQYLSENTGIPIEEIPNAFDAFNKLFPGIDDWFFDLPHSNIRWHRFFPICLSGIGANHRRFLHLDTDEKTYEELEELVGGQHTMSDLIKWNNLGYEIIR